MGDRVFIAQAGNTWIPAVLAMRAKGYAVVNQREGAEEICIATKDELRFLATDPVAVLGLIALYEERGSEWMATDQDIDQVMSDFGCL